MLEPLKFTEDGKEVTLRCRHADMWPPGWARSGQSAEALRAQGLLKDDQYERAKTWERVCGILAMSAEKCPACPHALRDDGLPHVAIEPVVVPAVSRKTRVTRKTRRKR